MDAPCRPSSHSSCCCQRQARSEPPNDFQPALPQCARQGHKQKAARQGHEQKVAQQSMLVRLALRLRCHTAKGSTPSARQPHACTATMHMQQKHSKADAGSVHDLQPALPQCARQHSMPVRLALGLHCHTAQGSTPSARQPYACTATTHMQQSNSKANPPGTMHIQAHRMN